MPPYHIGFENLDDYASDLWPTSDTYGLRSREDVERIISKFSNQEYELEDGKEKSGYTGAEMLEELENCGIDEWHFTVRQNWLGDTTVKINGFEFKRDRYFIETEMKGGRSAVKEILE